jgi:hypothetical protein
MFCAHSQSHSQSKSLCVHMSPCAAHAPFSSKSAGHVPGGTPDSDELDSDVLLSDVLLSDVLLPVEEPPPSASFEHAIVPATKTTTNARTKSTAITLPAS